MFIITLYADNTQFSRCTDQLQKMLQEQDAYKMNWNVFSVLDIECALESLKAGKDSGLDRLTNEHIIHIIRRLLCICRNYLT